MEFEERHKAYVDACGDVLHQCADRFLPVASTVSQAARYSLLSGGKRVRGVLVLAICEMLGGQFDRALYPACALEMVHAFSLIHDDLPCMDDDAMRRGRPACHIKFGEANALLAGDLLSIEAFSVLAASPLAAELRVAAVKELARAAGAAGMIYGQELDLQYERQKIDTGRLATMHEKKTGALFTAAAHLGAASAGQVLSVDDAVLLYTSSLGRVFQIVDDILDVESSDVALGKPVGSDVLQGKNTYVSLMGLTAAKQQARELTQTAVKAVKDRYGDASRFLCDFADRLLNRIN